MILHLVLTKEICILEVNNFVFLQVNNFVFLQVNNFVFLYF